MERNISSSSAYRKLRTNVEYNEKHPHMHSICLTSVNHGAGTTTVACELATAFAANRSKVLLIVILISQWFMSVLKFKIKWVLLKF